MKTHKLTFATMLLTFFLINNLSAQSHIDSLKIIPANPTSIDTLKIISYTFQTGAPCNLVAYNVTVNNTVISVNTYYPPGPLAVLCNSIDTVIIGVLSAGCYELHYFMTDTVVPVTYDIDTLSFCVQPFNSLPNNKYSEQKIKVYPNPFSTTTTIILNDEQINSTPEIRMYDIFGIEIKRICKIKNNEISIAKENLKSGQYILKVISKKEIIDIRKIIIE